MGDRLLTVAGEEIIVRGLWAYGFFFESLSAGMTCGMLVAAEGNPILSGKMLYFG